MQPKDIMSMTTEEREVIILAARERVGWHTSIHEAVPAVLDGNHWLVCCTIGNDNAKIVAVMPQVIDHLVQEQAVLRTQYAALEAVALGLAKAIRSAKGDAVYDSSYEAVPGEPYPVYAIDSEYVNALYRALARYEQATEAQ